MTIFTKTRQPIFLLQMEALLRRLPDHHPTRKRIESEHARMAAGFRGEQTIEYFSKELSSQSFIFHDLRFRSSPSSFFQMDFLVLTPHFLVIFESKNYIGHLLFETNTKQIIRTFNHQETILPDPLLQLKRQSTQLNQWLQANALPQMPVFSYVVLAHPSNRISISPASSTYENRIIRAIEIPETIQSLFKKNKLLYLNEQQQNALSSLLVQANRTYHPNILLHFSLKETDILTGMICFFCQKRSVLREKRGWNCSSCHSVPVHPHFSAAQDYYLLFGNKTTTRQFSSFLHISSLPISYRILTSLGARKIGGPKNRTYLLPDWLLTYSS